MSVDDFLQAINERIAHIYCNKAYKSFEKKDYEGALKYYQLALESDPENVYILYAMGMVHEKIGAEKRNLENLLDAEIKFLQALKFDPKHKESKEALEAFPKSPEFAAAIDDFEKQREDVGFGIRWAASYELIKSWER